MPAARPETFCTGLVMAMLTARTAVSALSTASTALSVITSTLSSCPFTLSTVPPTLLITGKTSSWLPRMNAVRLRRVPPNRTNAYARVSPVASRKMPRAR